MTTVVLALVGIGVLAGPALAEGEFPVRFKNNTDGRWADSKIYVTAFGQTTPGQWAYLKPDGTMAPIDHTMADAPGHLTKNGRNFPNMSFSLADASTVQMPSHVEGGRIYISVGEPMYIGISDDDKGWAGPDLHNPGDPNFDTVFDWYEFTYVYKDVHFGGNTTQVDQFGLPMTVRLQQDSSNYDRTTGITLSRDEVFRRYRKAVGPAFDGLATDKRILAPRTSAAFARGGARAEFLDDAIDDAWKAFRGGFSLTRLGQTFTGAVRGGDLHVQLEGSSQDLSIDKPTTHDVMACTGALANGRMSKLEGVLGAELCAAFNRGVGSTPNKWYQPSTYYKGTTRNNEYADFFHDINMHNMAYAFPFDDVNSQSSVTILDNDQPPSLLTIGIGW